MSSSGGQNVVVYKATNVLNGHFYIGYTARGLQAREKAHRQTANSGQGHRLHRAMRKYGHENILFEVMADFDGDEDLAKLYECEAIAKYKPEYNLSYGGEGGSLAEESRKKIGDANRGRKMPPSHGEKRRAFLTGRKHTEETKEKIRAAQKGRAPTRTGPLSEAVRAKISAANKGQIPWTAGKKHSLQTRARMSAWQIGRKLPEEHRARISEARKEAWKGSREKYLAAAQNAVKKALEKRKIPVRCVEDGRVFEGCSDADRFYSFRIGWTSRLLKGTVKNTTGRTFERYEAEK